MNIYIYISRTTRFLFQPVHYFKYEYYIPRTDLVRDARVDRVLRALLLVLCSAGLDGNVVEDGLATRTLEGEKT